MTLTRGGTVSSFLASEHRAVKADDFCELCASAAGFRFRCGLPALCPIRHEHCFFRPVELDSPRFLIMRSFSLPTLFNLGELAPLQRRTLALVYASSLAMIMGVNFIQPALPAMTKPFGVSDSALSLI